MKVLIATPLYPPEIGGPATYARLLEEELPKQGITVELVKFGDVRHLPKGVAHLAYFWNVFRAAYGARAILALDPVSVGLPAAIVAQLRKKPLLCRIGGDIVWERYVERTRHAVALSRFYTDPCVCFSLKERLIFFLTKYVLRRAAFVLFSTRWQMDLWTAPYDLQQERTSVLENRYPPLAPAPPSAAKKFLWAGRRIFLKQIELFEEAFRRAKERFPDIVLETVSDMHPDELRRKIAAAYALLLPSVSDISPNFIIEGVSAGKPFIMTSETGIRDRLEGMGIFVAPSDPAALSDAIIAMADEVTHRAYAAQIARVYRARPAREVAGELADYLNRLSP